MSVDFWYQKLQESTTLTFGGVDSLLEDGESHEFALELFKMEFKQLPDALYSLRLFFFDFHCRRFAGSQWTCQCQSRGSTIQLEKHLLFRSVARRRTVIVVAELADQRRNALCWAGIPLSELSLPMGPLPAGPLPAQLRRSFPLFSGSCRVLHLAESIGQLEPHLARQDAVLSLSLRFSSSTPSPIPPELPHFRFLEYSNAVRQQNEPPAKFTALLDNLKLGYGLPPAISDAFIVDLLDREFCYGLNRRWGGTNSQQQAGMRVLERRLRIGAHNGIGFLGEPLCVLLEPPEDGSDGGGNLPLGAAGRFRSRSLSRPTGGATAANNEWGTTIGAATAQPAAAEFNVRQSVRLRAIPLQPELALVFLLEYLVGSRMNGQNILANARLVRVAWAGWMPCARGQLSLADTVTLQLVGGPRPCPAPFGLCLRDLAQTELVRPPQAGLPSSMPLNWPASRARIELHFNFVPVTEGDRLSQLSKGLSQLSFPQTPLPKPDRRPDESGQRQQRVRSTSSSPGEMMPEEGTKKTVVVEVEKELELEEAEDGEEEEEADNLLWPGTRMEQRSGKEEAQQQSPLLLDGAAVRVELPSGRVSALPRRVLAQLARFPFPPPLANEFDGNPAAAAPQPVDPLQRRQLDPALEMGDRLHTAEVVLQLLAFQSTESGFPRAQSPPRIFLQFQFFRFPPVTTECLFADPDSIEGGGTEEEKGQQPMVLWREGAQQPGLTVRFALAAEDKRELADHLLRQMLHVHVWEADSLLHLGTASVPLKFLLRQGSPSVQCSLMCPVLQNGLPPAWTPSGNGLSLNGLLCLRMASLGRLPSSSAIGMSALSTGPVRPFPTAQRAQSLRSAHSSPLERFLAFQKLDLSQRGASLFGPEQQRRLRQWTRLKQEGAPAVDDNANDRSAALLAATGHNKFLFAEELAAYRALRREGKALALLRAVFSGITVRLQLHTSLGQLLLFPFPVRNPLAQDCVCVLESNDPRLSPVISTDELAHFRRSQGGWQQREFASACWSSSAADGGGAGQPEWRLALRAGERLELPMRFDPGTGEDDQCCGPVEARAFVRCVPSGQPVAILELALSVRRPWIAHHLRWFTPEQCKLVRTVPLGGRNQRRALSVRCSDPGVLCLLSDGGHTLRVECAVGECPQLRELLVFLYSTSLGTQLLSVFRISIHSLVRLHSATVPGQPFKVPLPLASSVARPPGELVRLFCSPPPPESSFLRFHPAPAFPVQQLVQPVVNLSLAQSGRFHFLLSAVLSSAQRPLGLWLLSVDVGQPNVTKLFQVTVPSRVQGIVQKRLPLDNPLGVSRQFRIASSNPELVSVPCPSPSPLAPLSSVPLQLHIHTPLAQQRPAQHQVLLFVQDAQTGAQEEALQLNIRFQ